MNKEQKALNLSQGLQVLKKQHIKIPTYFTLKKFGRWIPWPTKDFDKTILSKVGDDYPAISGGKKIYAIAFNNISCDEFIRWDRVNGFTHLGR